VHLTTRRVEAGAAFVAFVVLGAFVSVPLSTLAYGNGVLGGVLAAATAAPIGLVVSVSFVLFTRKLTGIDGTATPA
jgi:hypothetical protein